MCADRLPIPSIRPLRDFVLQLPLLPVNDKSEIYYAAADPALLVQLADNGDIAMRTVHLGLSAIGLLLANSGAEFEAREISADAMESLGWLLAEWGEFAAVAHSISAGCQRHITDYRPGVITVISNAKP